MAESNNKSATNEDTRHGKDEAQNRLLKRIDTLEAQMKVVYDILGLTL